MISTSAFAETAFSAITVEERSEFLQLFSVRNFIRNSDELLLFY